MTPAAFAFVITLAIPSYGGDVAITIQTPTLEGCTAARRAARQMLVDETVKHTLGPCEPVKEAR